MTVTDPSASTAGSLRIMALRRAMRWTPSASVTVMMAGNPSGIAEAIKATAIMNISAGAWLRHRVPNRKVAAEAASMKTASLNPK